MSVVVVLLGFLTITMYVPLSHRKLFLYAAPSLRHALEPTHSTGEWLKPSFQSSRPPMLPSYTAQRTISWSRTKPHNA